MSQAGLIAGGGKERAANGIRHFQSAGVSGEGEENKIWGKAKRRMAGSWEWLLALFLCCSTPRSDKVVPSLQPSPF